MSEVRVLDYSLSPFAEDHYIEQSISQAVAGAASSVAVADPDGGSTALRHTGWIGSTIEIQPSPAFSLDAGQEYTWTFYVLAEADSRTHSPLLRITGGSGTTNSVACRFTLSTGSGVSIVTFSSSSAGPAYTSSNAFRSEQIDGTDWWKISLRIADYGGDLAFLRPFHYFYQSLNAQNSFASWKWELRYGNHLAGAPLDLSVIEGAEIPNLLNSAGVFDLSDFPTTIKMASVGASPIAAPDGTMTAIRCIGDLTGEATTLAVLNNSASPIDFTGQWSDAVAWTYSFYVYRPSIESGGTNYGKFQFSLFGASGYNNYIQWRCTATDPLYSVVAATPSTSSFTYSAERSIAVEEVGNSGWTKYTVTLVDTEQNITNIQLQMQHRGGDHYLDTWAPALRYGDWVARGKVGFSLPPIEWVPVSSASSPRYSSELFLDGKSAVDWPLDVAGSGMWGDNFVTPTKGRLTWSIYMRSTDASTYTNSSNRIRLNVRTRATITRIDRAFGIELLEGSVAKMDGALLAGEELTFERVGNTRWYHFVFSRTFDPTHGDMQDAAMYFYRDGSPPETTLTVSHPRVTVGNPADARGYFVSGPQNLLGDGSDYDPATGWYSTGAPTVSTNAAVAPNGRLEADAVTFASGFPTNQFGVNKGISSGQTISYSFYYKIDSGLSGQNDTLVFKMKVGGTDLESMSVGLAYSTDSPVISVTGVTTGGPGYTVNDVDVFPISNDWVRVSMSITDYSSTATLFQVYHYGYGTPTITYWGSEVTTLSNTTFTPPSLGQLTTFGDPISYSWAKLRLRRGSDVGRATLTGSPPAGEPLYCTDTKTLYIGDGTTRGGTPAVKPASVLQLTTSLTTNINNLVTDNLIGWDTQTVLWGQDITHDVVTNNSRIELASDGLYEISASVRVNATGTSATHYNGVLRLRANGTTNFGPSSAGGYISYSLNNDEATFVLPSFVHQFTAGDYFELLIDRESAQSRGVYLTANKSYLYIKRIG